MRACSRRRASPCARGAVVATALLAAGCSSPAPSSPAGDAREAALLSLQEATGHRWTARWTGESMAPVLLRGRTPPLLGAGAGSAVAVAWRFLVRHPELFFVDPDHDELLSDGVDTDELGMVHVRLRRRYRGLPVFGDWLGVHFGSDGGLVRIEGRLVPIERLERAVPLIDSRTAAATALAALGPAADAAAPSLVVDLAPGAQAGAAVGRLAWRVEALVVDGAEPARSALFIDAGTGDVYRRDELLDTLRGSGLGVFGDRRDFEVALSGSRFVLEDRGRGAPPQRVLSARNTPRVPGFTVASPRPDRFEDPGDGPGAAIDAAANLSLVVDHFLRVHGRRGPGGRGEGARATVHFGRGYTGAFWDGDEVVFGDGDGKTVAPLSAGLDIVAHEYGHAVIEAAAELGHRGEPGAVAEALADIFACFVERDVRGAEANWSIGEAVTIDGFPGFRDLADPRRTADPVHMEELRLSPEDRGQIHANSTIAGHAAYLMAAGGTDRRGLIPVAALDPLLVERVFYRALTHYLGPGSDFTALADATLAAATDLTGEGSAAVTSIGNAWRAVGVVPTT